MSVGTRASIEFARTVEEAASVVGCFRRDIRALLRMTSPDLRHRDGGLLNGNACKCSTLTRVRSGARPLSGEVDIARGILHHLHRVGTTCLRHEFDDVSLGRRKPDARVDVQDTVRDLPDGSDELTGFGHRRTRQVGWSDGEGRSGNDIHTERLERSDAEGLERAETTDREDLRSRRGAWWPDLGESSGDVLSARTVDRKDPDTQARRLCVTLQTGPAPSMDEDLVDRITSEIRRRGVPLTFLSDIA